MTEDEQRIIIMTYIGGYASSTNIVYNWLHQKMIRMVTAIEVYYGK